MKILTEQEIALWLHIADEPINFARAIESAVLAKLKAQEPMFWMTPSGEGWMMRTEPPTIDTKLGWTALYEHPLPPDDVVRYAERYRWLRDSAYCTYPAVFKACQAWNTLRGETLDAAIDAAMEKMGYAEIRVG